LIDLITSFAAATARSTAFGSAARAGVSAAGAIAATAAVAATGVRTDADRGISAAGWTIGLMFISGLSADLVQSRLNDAHALSMSMIQTA
jgi:hypothetical protein